MKWGVHMAKDLNSESNSRSEKRTKRRKTNLILNTLIAVVLLLIVVVAYFIFIAGGHSSPSAANKPKTENVQKNASQNKDSASNQKDHSNSSSNNGSKNNSNGATNSNDDSINSQNAVVEKSGEPNVKETVTNPNWKPVGTSQTSGHNYSSDSNSPDWQEKLKAIGYAVGLDPSAMTVWYLEHGNSDNQAIGTITPKNEPSKVYRVYLDWVDGQGWKPSKVLVLDHNDKR
jgi:cytoskeletal protein RodZ